MSVIGPVQSRYHEYRLLLFDAVIPATNAIFTCSVSIQRHSRYSVYRVCDGVSVSPDCPQDNSRTR